MEKFDFGKNWKRFLKVHNPQRLEVAKSCITDFMGVKDLRGKLFLDIGCGSGYFSLAAWKLGANVISFDPFKGCVECCKFFKSKVDNPENWKIYQGSVLDKEFLKKLPKADIVYSHGVLHHTGDMWTALENVKSLVKDNGYLYIAIYNKVHNTFSGSKMWWRIKYVYNHLPKILQYICEGLYMLRYGIFNHLIHFKNPFKYFKNHYHKRGAYYILDVRDWLGGFPYEYARPDEIFNFYKKDFILINLLTRNTLALNVFLFKKK